MKRSLLLLALVFTSLTATAECTKALIAQSAKSYLKVDQNRDGSFQTHENSRIESYASLIQRNPTLSSGAAGGRYDINGDGSFTPMDVLRASNILNRETYNACSWLHIRAFALLDQNGDGVYSMAENIAAQNVANQWSGGVVAEHDYDYDGRIGTSGGSIRYYGYAMGDVGAAAEMHRLYGSP